MSRSDVYAEKLSSARTEMLFAGLTALFLALFGWQARSGLFSGWSITFFCFFAFFLFYSLNYHTLRLRLDGDSLQLTFGLFTWVVPLANIESCRIDGTSLWRIGGAGIHFTLLEGRYRAMFNFLEYPRVVIALKAKMGPVREIAFSTRRAQEVIRKIQGLERD